MRVVIDKEGQVTPAGAASLIGTFRRGWTSPEKYRIFYCSGCRQPFTANVGEDTVHDCPSDSN
jgi:hypothetical protein